MNLENESSWPQITYQIRANYTFDEKEEGDAYFKLHS